jgi:plastocyanin
MVVPVLLASGCTNEGQVEERQPSPAPTEAAAPALTPGFGIVTGTVPVAEGVRAYLVLTPEDSSQVPPPSTRPVLDQVQMTFVPGLLFARAGYPVEFRSSDAELHNVNVKRSRTGEQEFNVAIPAGGTFEHTFKNPGFYDVNCDIHPAMFAQILVTATPHVAISEADGSFRFPDVPPGPYTLTTYAGSQRVEQQMKIGPGENQVTVALERASG